MKKTTTKVELMEFTSNLRPKGINHRRSFSQWKYSDEGYCVSFSRRLHPFSYECKGYGLLMKHIDDKDEECNRGAARYLIGKLRDEVDDRFSHDGELTLLLSSQFDPSDIWHLINDIREDIKYSVLSTVDFWTLFGKDDGDELTPNCAWAGIMQTKRRERRNV